MIHEHEHGREQEHDDDDEEEESVGISGWARSAARRTCPACGAAGALSLGGGLFCPTCGEVTTSPGYEAPPKQE